MSDISDFAIFPLFLARVLLSIFLLRLLPFTLVFSHLHLVVLLFQFRQSRAIFTHCSFLFNIFSFLFVLLPAFFIRFLVLLRVSTQSIIFVIFFSLFFFLILSSFSRHYFLFLFSPLFFSFFFTALFLQLVYSISFILLL